MRNYLKFRVCFILVALILFTTNANAIAVSLANAYVDWDSLAITGDVKVAGPESESFITIDNEDVSLSSSQFGGAYLFDELDDFNATASAGNDGSDFFESLTFTDSIIGDLAPASATSIFSVLVPFSQYTPGGSVGVSFDYGLFTSAETDSAGESATSTASVQYGLLDAGFNLLGNDFIDDLFVEALDGAENFNSLDSSLNMGYLGLDVGDYFLSIETFAASFTEANAVVNAVPAPGALLLLLTGLLFMARKKQLNLFTNQLQREMKVS